MNRYPDYHRTDRNPDWERATPRELPRDVPYKPEPCACPRCARRRSPLDFAVSVLAWCGWLFWAYVVLVP